jgi:hypothetical protein
MKKGKYFDEDDFEDYDDYNEDDFDDNYSYQPPKKNQSSSSTNKTTNKTSKTPNNNNNNQKTKSSISRKTQNVQIREKDQKLLESILQEKNSSNHLSDKSNTTVNLSNQEKNKMKTRLTKLGFKDKDIQRSFQYCTDVNQAIDWLLINVEEKDLPESYLQKKGKKEKPNFRKINFSLKKKKNKKLQQYKSSHPIQIQGSSLKLWMMNHTFPQ